MDEIVKCFMNLYIKSTFILTGTLQLSPHLLHFRLKNISPALEKALPAILFGHVVTSVIRK